MNIGIIFAGGVGKRMHSKDVPKQFLYIYGKPIIVHTLEHFQKNDEIDCVVVSCVESHIEFMNELTEKYRLTKVVDIVSGGNTGQQSIYNALKAAESIDKDSDSIVLIHDGVRPLISSDLLTENIRCVRKYGSCITAGVVKETIVVIDNDGMITQVPSRSHSRVAKAPQSFFLKDIIDVHRRAMADGVYDSIDSCTLMQSYNHSLHIIDGPIDNIKITTPEDFFTMRSIYETRENEQIYLN